MRLDPAEVAKLARLAEARGGKVLGIAAGPEARGDGAPHPWLRCNGKGCGFVKHRSEVGYCPRCGRGCWHHSETPPIVAQSHPEPDHLRDITKMVHEAPGLAPGRHEFTVEGFKPPTLNRLMRGKVADRIRLGKEAREAIRSAFLESRIPLAWTPRRVSLEVTLGPRQRPCDVDSPWKATLDGLGHAGAIVNDSARWCQLGGLAFRRGEATSTRIILEDLEDA